MWSSVGGEISPTLFIIQPLVELEIVRFLMNFKQCGRKVFECVDNIFKKDLEALSGMIREEIKSDLTLYNEVIID